MKQINHIPTEAIVTAVQSFFAGALNPHEEIRPKIPATLHATCRHPVTKEQFGIYHKKLVGSLLRKEYVGIDIDKILKPFVVIASLADPENVTRSPGTVHVTFELYHSPAEDVATQSFSNPFFSLTLMGFPAETYWGFKSFSSVKENNGDVLDFAVGHGGSISLTRVELLAAHFKAIRYLLKSLQKLLPGLPILED